MLEKKTLHEGYTQLYEYKLAVESLYPKSHSSTIQSREILHCNDSIIVLVFAPEIDSFVLCQEFRAGVFFNKDHDDPFIFECVAGAIDKKQAPEEIAKIEVIEETGLIPGELKHIATVYASPGRVTEKTHLYFTEVAGTPKTGIFGIAHEGEEIVTHIIERKKLFQMMDEKKINDSMLLLSLSWFRLNQK